MLNVHSYFPPLPADEVFSVVIEMAQLSSCDLNMGLLVMYVNRWSYMGGGIVTQIWPLKVMVLCFALVYAYSVITFITSCLHNRDITDTII